ncbi:TPA: hypothetical protein MYO83_005422 [Klebsiella michiganensis]|nr:hypothetical protein [Klebsiella michiganensis]HCB1848934.1 hypothetical protein [Klebsiella oxytoca]
MRNIYNMDKIGFIQAIPDSLIYYYHATQPRFSLYPDNSPAIQLQVFRNPQKITDNYHAMLSMQTELFCSHEQAQAAARANREIPPGAQLRPLPAITSTATLSIAQLAMMPASNTSSSGQQRCYMQARLSQQHDIELLTAMMSNPQAVPISISYKIDYLQQLAPATFELQADWHKVYTCLETDLGVNFFIFSTQIKKLSEELISRNVVSIIVRDADPRNYIAQAVEELSKILLSEFFTPITLIDNPQSSPRFGFYFQKLSVTDINLRTLSAKFTQTTVVKRSIYPQALFAELLNGSHYQPDRAIIYTDLTDHFFTHRKVAINLLNPQLDDNILAVSILMCYGDIKEIFIFSHDNVDTQCFETFVIKEPHTQKISFPVNYSFTLYFENAVCGQSEVTSEVMQTSLAEIYLDVDSLFSRFSFMIETSAHFNWQWYQSVQVTIIRQNIYQLRDEILKSFVITALGSKIEFSTLLLNPNCYHFYIEKIYTPTDNSPHLEKKSRHSVGQNILLNAELYPQRKLQIFTENVNWQIVKKVSVFARYLCNQQGVVLQQKFTFNKDTITPQLFSADQPDPTRKCIELRVLPEYHIKQNLKPIIFNTDADTIDISTLI